MFTLPPSTHCSPPSSSLHGWLLTHGAPVGACPAGYLHPQGRSQVGPERAARLLPLYRPGSLLKCACLHSCVCRVFVFLLHVLLLPSLTPPYILALLCTPQSPSSRHPSSSQELEKPLSGARPLPHPPSQGVCPALLSILPSVSADGLAGRGVIKEWGRWASLQPASGPISSPPSPRH